MLPVGSSWDRGGATRPADRGDHASLSGPYHSGRIQRLRDNWAKNLQSLELPHGWCGHHGFTCEEIIFDNCPKKIPETENGASFLVGHQG